MIITEKDAANTTCVVTRGHDIKSCCLGSKCMAWRWWFGDSEYIFEYGSLTEPPNNSREWIPALEHPGKWASLNNDRRGYCGLAGKPE